MPHAHSQSASVMTTGAHRNPVPATSVSVTGRRPVTSSGSQLSTSTPTRPGCFLLAKSFRYATRSADKKNPLPDGPVREARGRAIEPREDPHHVRKADAPALLEARQARGAEPPDLAGKRRPGHALLAAPCIECSMDRHGIEAQDPVRIDAREPGLLGVRPAIPGNEALGRAIEPEQHRQHPIALGDR